MVKKEVKVKEKKGKGKEKMVNKVGDNLEEMDRVLLRIPPISLFRIMTNLTEKQRQYVREMGFSGILEYRLSEIPTSLGYWVLDKFDEDSCSLIFRGNTIHVTREAMHEVLGIPMGIIHVDALKGTSRSNKLTKSWKRLFGGNIGRIYHSNVEDIIQSQQEDIVCQLLKVRNEMCHELENNECTTPKDNMDGSKEATNANGNPEGDMLSSTQMYGTPTELIRLIDDGITYSEKWVADCIFTGRFTPTDIIFKTNTETHSLEVQRSVFESLYPRIRIAGGAIDVFTHVLNYAEKFRGPILTEYDVCQYADKQSRKMLCEDWDAKYKSDLFIQNMSNVLRATLYQNLKMVDLLVVPFEILILDNINSDEQDLVKRYGQILRVLTKLFEDYLSFEKHHRKGEMKFAEYKILRMGCRTMKNFVDCVFAM
ncbi:hypothetical protein Tco_0313399 [Tanacetum coccineum]